MMKVYKYFSKGLDSDVKLSYTDGALSGVEIDSAKVTTDNKAYFFITESQFLGVCKKHNIPVIEVERVVTFEMFWERYNYKASGRIPTLKAWEKLTKEEQIAAFDYIPVYDALWKGNKTAKKYGASYLNSKIYIK